MTPEGLIKRQICEYLELRSDIFFWNQESIGQFNKKRGIFLKKKSRFQKNGVPDIICLIRVGTLPPIMIGLEVKSPKGKQTESQMEFERDYKTFGGFYYVVRSPAEASRALSDATQLIKSRIPVRQI